MGYVRLSHSQPLVRNCLMNQPQCKLGEEQGSDRKKERERKYMRVCTYFVRNIRTHLSEKVSVYTIQLLASNRQLEPLVVLEEFSSLETNEKFCYYLVNETFLPSSSSQPMTLCGRKFYTTLVSVTVSISHSVLISQRNVESLNSSCTGQSYRIFYSFLVRAPNT